MDIENDNGGGNKAMLDELHKRKIDLADEILVLDVDGYIGDSTRSEIEYAKTHGKSILYLSDDIRTRTSEGEANKSEEPHPDRCIHGKNHWDCLTCEADAEAGDR